MSFLQSNCPSCGAPIEFKAGSTIVVVCSFCRSVVARTDRALEDLGKVAEIIETESPLKIGLKGKYLNQNFELTGRAQLRHASGGVWDEWYATFSNGWVGWLAEAQGRFYLTFYQPVPPETRIPGFAELSVGAPFGAKIAASEFVVAEKGMATAIAAEGEIPYQLTPNETSYYADLSGANHAFATIDYSFNPPWAFVGKEVGLAEIGLEKARPADRAARSVAAAGLNCPNCGGPISLKVPNAAERVTCPNCDSLLDVRQGNLKYLTTLKNSDASYAFEIGAVAQFAGKEPMQVIGAVTRSVNIDGVDYFWREYLLYRPKIGFRWLVESDNHWNFVETIAPGDVEAEPFFSKGATARYKGDGAAKGKTFKIFQHAVGEVRHVKGEFYWRVTVGEQVLMTDYVNAPFMLSREESGTSNSREVNWSLAVYLPKNEVERAFQISNLPAASGVAPNQPFPQKGLFSWSAAILVLYIIVAVLLAPFTSGGKVLNQSFTLPPTANAQATQTIFSQPFELKSNRNVEIKVSAPVDNSWASLDVDLVNEQNNEIESVPLNIEYYSGVDDGEAWSEGSKESSAIVSSVPAGKYTLRIGGSWQNFQQPLTVAVVVSQGVTRGVNWCCGFVLLSITPLFALLWQFAFESRRWHESMFGSSTSNDSDSKD
jgi:hypothetical protein